MLDEVVKRIVERKHDFQIRKPNLVYEVFPVYESLRKTATLKWQETAGFAQNEKEWGSNPGQSPRFESTHGNVLVAARFCDSTIVARTHYYTCSHEDQDSEYDD